MRVSIIAMCMLGAALASSQKEKKQAALELKVGHTKMATKKMSMKKRGQEFLDWPTAPTLRDECVSLDAFN